MPQTALNLRAVPVTPVSRRHYPTRPAIAQAQANSASEFPSCWSPGGSRRCSRTALLPVTEDAQDVQEVTETATRFGPSAGCLGASRFGLRPRPRYDRRRIAGEGTSPHAVAHAGRHDCGSPPSRAARSQPPLPSPGSLPSHDSSSASRRLLLAWPTLPVDLGWVGCCSPLPTQPRQLCYYLPCAISGGRGRRAGRSTVPIPNGETVGPGHRSKDSGHGVHCGCSCSGP